MSDELKQKLLRISEACHVSSVCRSRGYQFVHDGTWPSVRIGKSIRVPYDGLMEWIDNLTVEGDDNGNS